MYWGGGHTRSDTKGAWPSFLQIFCPPPDSLDLGRQYGLTQSDRIRHVNTGQGGACFYGSDFIKGREPGVHKFFWDPCWHPYGLSYTTKFDKVTQKSISGDQTRPHVKGRGPSAPQEKMGKAPLAAIWFDLERPNSAGWDKWRMGVFVGVSHAP